VLIGISKLQNALTLEEIKKRVAILEKEVGVRL